MNTFTPDRKRLTLAAAGIVAGWLTATALGHVCNPCLTVGLAAIVMGVVAITLFPGFLADLFRPSLSHVITGVFAATVMVIATYGLFPIVARIFPDTTGATSALYRIMGIPHATPVILGILTLIILGEEILWRGVVQEAVAARFNPAGRGAVLAIAVAALIYGLSHTLIGSGLLVIVAIACGVFWSALRWKTGSLLPGLIAHVIWDFCIVVYPVVHS